MVSRFFDANLSDLLSKLRRDPDSYIQDFETQFDNYASLESAYLSSASEHVPRLESLLMFLSQVIQYFPDFSPRFCENVSSALLSKSFGMNPVMRMAYLKAFMRLRTKGFIMPQKSFDVAFRLHLCQDKATRKMLRGFVIGDVKHMNQKNKSPKINSALQSFLAKKVKDSNTTVAKEAVLILIELYRKSIWKDDKTVNIIAEACLAKSKKVYSKAVGFLLGHTNRLTERNSDGDSDDENFEHKIRQLKLGHRVGTKSKKRGKRLERLTENLRKKNERKKCERGPTGVNFSALNMIYDPQTFTERLMRKLERCNDCLENRLLLLELISHFIGFHQLLILNFYPSLQKFLRPQQREITRLMLFAAQASHDQIPPDAILPMMRTITDNFVTDRASAEAITVGLNTIREICSRCPFAVDEDLLSDLVEYKSYRNKNVVAAARSLIRLYRQINPSMLPKKELGRPTESIKEALGNTGTGATTSEVLLEGPARVFGQRSVASGIPGAEVLLEADESDKRKRTPEENAYRKRKANDNKGRPSKRSRIDSEIKRDDAIEGTDSDDEVKEVESGSESKIEDLSSLNSETDDFEEGEKAEDINQGDEAVEVRARAPAKVEADQTPAFSTFDLVTTRVLTDEEFQVIRKRQAEKKVQFAAASGRKKIKKSGEQEIVIDEEDLAGDVCGSDSDEDPATAMGLVTMSNITKLVKRAKSSKTDRLESIEEGREGRPKFGFKVNRMNPFSSTTNREKRKKKTFQMIKHKVRRKVKRSFREKQTALREHLKKVTKQMRK